MLELHYPHTLARALLQFFLSSRNGGYSEGEWELLTVIYRNPEAEIVYNSYVPYRTAGSTLWQVPASLHANQTLFPYPIRPYQATRKDPLNHRNPAAPRAEDMGFKV